MTYLKFKGLGVFIPGVPPRDLTKEEAEKYGEEKLIKSGLYVKAKPSKKAAKKDGE